jgi:hypothetical protein
VNKAKMRVSRFSHLALGILGSMLILATWTSTAPIDSSAYCDPLLEPIVTHPYGYKIRGSRCEGIYAKKVWSTTLRLASFTEHFEDYDLQLAKELIVEWQRSTNRDVRLRVQSVQRKLYYQMDTVRPSPLTNYNWPVEILVALNIQRESIGVLGWTTFSFGKIERQVYLPLRITQQGGKTRLGSYNVLIVPGRELQEIFVSYASVQEDGSPGFFFLDSVPLHYGYYPPERSVSIPISPPNKPGLYYIEIGANLVNGEIASKEFWFYHAGP